MLQISLRLAVLFLSAPVMAAGGQEPLDDVVWVRSTDSDSYSGQGDRGIGIVYFSGGAGYGRVNGRPLVWYYTRGC